MNVSECEVKDFICMVGTKIAVSKISEHAQVTYAFGGFRDNQSISILKEKITTNAYGEVESIEPENFFISVKEGTTLELPVEPSLDNQHNTVFEVVAIYPERNSIQLCERIVSCK